MGGEEKIRRSGRRWCGRGQHSRRGVSETDLEVLGRSLCTEMCGVGGGRYLCMMKEKKAECFLNVKGIVVIVKGVMRGCLSFRTVRVVAV